MKAVMAQQVHNLCSHGDSFMWSDDIEIGSLQASHDSKSWSWIGGVVSWVVLPRLCRDLLGALDPEAAADDLEPEERPVLALL